MTIKSSCLVLCSFVACWYVHAEGIGWTETSMTCTDDDYFHKACIFNNLVLHKGDLYFVTDRGVTPEVPPVRLDEWVGFPWKDRDSKASKGQLEEVSNHILPITSSDLQKLVNEQPTIEHVAQALLVRPQILGVNWWHNMDDATSWFYRWCLYLGHCEYNAESAAKSAYLILYAKDGDGMQFFNSTGPASSFKDLYQCAAQHLLWVHDRVRRTHKAELTRFPDKVFVFGRAVAGSGNTTGNLFHHKELRQGKPSSELRMKAISFYRACNGLSAVPEVKTVAQPNVVLIQRPFLSGRSIVNMLEIQNELRQLKPELNVTVVFMEGLSFTRQAQIFDSADILLLPHGSAAMNLYFLPAVFSVIDVNGHDIHAFHQSAVLNRLPFPPYVFTRIELRLRENQIEPLSQRILSTKGLLDNMTCEEKVQLLSGKGLDGPGRQHLYNYIPEVKVVVMAVRLAVEDWRDKRLCEKLGVGCTGEKGRARRDMLMYDAKDGTIVPHPHRPHRPSKKILKKRKKKH